MHTAWGRTLKDVFQRYKALKGFDQRYQNGFDCQGLWIEVGVERQLGFNSKREIEEYGLERFAARCRDVVVESSQQLTRGSIRLGQWMDWGNDYFTFSDTNIEYIWGFLKIVNERGWLYMGHRATAWCPRCGTSLSQHELTQGGVYQDKSDPSLYVRLPLLERPGESLVVWTTTPWTLPANVAAAVHPEGEYGLRENGEWVLAARYPNDTFVRRVKGTELVGLRYQGPFDNLPPGAASSTASSRGTRSTSSRSREPASSTSRPEPVRTTSSSAARSALPCSRRSTSAAVSTTTTAGCTASRRSRRPTRSSATSPSGASSSSPARTSITTRTAGAATRPIVYRLSDDWFIGVDEIRPTLLEENAKVEWVPEYMGKRMDDWLRNMGDWNISRRRYYGLPLPFYPCACGHLNVIGSKAELAERALDPLDDLPELRRPWIDRIRIRCEYVRRAGHADPRGRRRLARRRDRPVLDARLAEPGAGSPRATRPAPPRG